MQQIKDKRIFRVKLFLKAQCEERNDMKKKIRAVLSVLLVFVCVWVLSAGVSADKVTELIVAGTPFGVKMHMEGVTVVGIPGGKGPAADAGLRKGDVITAIDGVPITSAEAFAEAVKASEGKTLSLELKSGALSRTAKITPVSDESGEYKLGVWVKDSAAGIGTITFIEPKTMTFAGLGHGICDAESGEVIPFSFGSAEEVSLSGIVMGKPSAPGELRGSFVGKKIGKLLKNDLTGVYGVLVELPLTLVNEKYPVCPAAEVKEGKASVFATVDGDGRQAYEIEIFDLVRDGKDRNFSIRVTDESLLSKTGGIVQGMSGSPIIQDGKLIGAVTHVLVNDPTRGYGIFIENMLEAVG